MNGRVRTATAWIAVLSVLAQGCSPAWRLPSGARAIGEPIRLSSTSGTLGVRWHEEDGSWSATPCAARLIEGYTTGRQGDTLAFAYVVRVVADQPDDPHCTKRESARVGVPFDVTVEAVKPRSNSEVLVILGIGVVAMTVLLITSKKGLDDAR